MSSRAAPRALPGTPAQLAPAAEPSDGFAVLRALLPSRDPEDVLAGRIRFALGDQMIELAVLPIRLNRTWKEKCSEQLSLALSFARTDLDTAGLLNALSGMTDRQLDLLIAYDVDHQLPERDWIEDHATEAQALRAFLAVLAAAFPFVATVLAILLESGDLQAGIGKLWAMPEVQLAMRRALSESTSGSPASTAGPPESSNGS